MAEQPPPARYGDRSNAAEAATQRQQASRKSNRFFMVGFVLMVSWCFCLFLLIGGSLCRSGCKNILIIGFVRRCHRNVTLFSYPGSRLPLRKLVSEDGYRPRVLPAVCLLRPGNESRAVLGGVLFCKFCPCFNCDV